MNENQRRAIVRQAALDMAAAGLGWHEDAIERLTRPPLPPVDKIMAFLADMDVFTFIPCFQHRSKLTEWRRYRSSAGERG